MYYDEIYRGQEPERRSNVLRRVPKLPTSSHMKFGNEVDESDSESSCSRLSRSSSEYLLTSKRTSEVQSRRKPILVISSKKTSRVLSNTNLEISACVTDASQGNELKKISSTCHLSDDCEDLSSEASWPGDEITIKSQSMFDYYPRYENGYNTIPSVLHKDKSKSNNPKNVISKFFNNKSKKSISKIDISVITN